MIISNTINVPKNIPISIQLYEFEFPASLVLTSSGWSFDESADRA